MASTSNHCRPKFHSYVTAYAQESAKIDARLKHLEKLAEEQAALTRTVETIKDEIAAGAKSRESRWAFRKDVYVNLVTATSDIIRAFAEKIGLENLRLTRDLRDEQYAVALQSKRVANLTTLEQGLKLFFTYTALAPLATADEVQPLISEATKQLKGIDFNSPGYEAQITHGMATLGNLQQELYKAARKDLWGTAAPSEPKSEAATKG
jgi:hypothetical protein